MTITSNENLAIQYYLDRLKDGPQIDKKIQNIVNERFKVSGAAIRNKLIADGVIELKKDGYNPKNNRNVFIVTLIDKSKVKFIEPQLQQHRFQSMPIQSHWPEGWKKSHGNAFDWRNTSQGLFTKSELASMQTKVKSNPGFTGDSVHTYSRAKANV